MILFSLLMHALRGFVCFFSLLFLYSHLSLLLHANFDHMDDFFNKYFAFLHFFVFSFTSYVF